MVRLFAVSLAVLLVTGCQSSAPIRNVPIEERGSSARSPAEPSYQPSQPVVTSPKTRPAAPRQTNAAVVALLGKAQRQEQALDYAAAAASLERAIRIAPRDANLYFRLAVVRIKQESDAQAGQLCRKAISLAEDSRYMELKCEALLGSPQT